jgi:hypothetical protein
MKRRVQVTPVGELRMSAAAFDRVMRRALQAEPPAPARKARKRRKAKPR